MQMSLNAQTTVYSHVMIAHRFDDCTPFIYQKANTDRHCLNVNRHLPYALTSVSELANVTAFNVHAAFTRISIIFRLIINAKPLP